jgi:hypothetical protein
MKATIIIDLWDIIQKLFYYYLKCGLGKWTVSPSSGKMFPQMGSIDRVSPYLRSNN